MTSMPAPTALAVRILALLLVLAAGSQAQEAPKEVKVMTSGGFTAPFLELVPAFESAAKTRVSTAFGASMGGAPDSIPSRLDRGEPVDVVILAAPALDDLIKAGKVRPGSRVDLVKSLIGMSVRKGAPKPDISTAEKLKQVLLDAKSLAYSASASGTYLSTEGFAALGIWNQIKDKAKRIESERVGTIVARGEAEIGFQQVSELLPIEGTDFVGTLPPPVQRETIFSAGIATNAKNLAEAQRLIEFLSSPAAEGAIRRSGLEPAGQYSANASSR